MRTLRILGLLIFCFAGLVALAQDQNSQKPADSQQAAATSTKATVHFYRYKQFVGSALAPSIFCDGVELARMENGRYFAATLDPGKHTFTSNDKQSGVDLDLKAGEEYFLRVEIAAGVAKGHGRLILMPREQGSYELKSDKLKPLDAKKVADKGVVSTTEPKLQPTALEQPQK